MHGHMASVQGGQDGVTSLEGTGFPGGRPFQGSAPSLLTKMLKKKFIPQTTRNRESVDGL